MRLRDGEEKASAGDPHGGGEYSTGQQPWDVPPRVGLVENPFGSAARAGLGWRGPAGCRGSSGGSRAGGWSSTIDLRCLWRSRLMGLPVGSGAWKRDISPLFCPRERRSCALLWVRALGTAWEEGDGEVKEEGGNAAAAAEQPASPVLPVPPCRGRAGVLTSHRGDNVPVPWGTQAAGAEARATVRPCGLRRRGCAGAVSQRPSSSRDAPRTGWALVAGDRRRRRGVCTWGPQRGQGGGCAVGAFAPFFFWRLMAQDEERWCQRSPVGGSCRAVLALQLTEDPLPVLGQFESHPGAHRPVSWGQPPVPGLGGPGPWHSGGSQEDTDGSGGDPAMPRHAGTSAGSPGLSLLSLLTTPMRRRPHPGAELGKMGAKREGT